MINFDEMLVSTLNTILPVYHEFDSDISTSGPYITYLNSNDVSYKEGDTLRYSKVEYTLKINGNSADLLKPFLQPVDNSMNELGFIRKGLKTQNKNNTIQIELTYEGLGKEITWQEF